MLFVKSSQVYIVNMDVRNIHCSLHLNRSKLETVRHGRPLPSPNSVRLPPIGQADDTKMEDEIQPKKKKKSKKKSRKIREEEEVEEL